MTSKEAFEEWWNESKYSQLKHISNKAPVFDVWQAACEYQKQKDAEICMRQPRDTDCAEAILNQRDE